MKQYELRYQRKTMSGLWEHRRETFDNLEDAKSDAESLMRNARHKDVSLAELTYALGSTKVIPLAPNTVTQDVWVGFMGGQPVHSCHYSTMLASAKERYGKNVTWYYGKVELTRLED